MTPEMGHFERSECWCEPTPDQPHPWKPWEINLCDPDGIVRRGDMHHGQDYPCTGHAHWSGYHIRCTTLIHGDGPVPVIGFMPPGDF